MPFFELLIDLKHARGVNTVLQHGILNPADYKNTKISYADLNIGDFAILYGATIICVGEITNLRSFAGNVSNRCLPFNRAFDIREKIDCTTALVVGSEVPLGEIKGQKMFNYLRFARLRRELNEYVRVYFDRLINTLSDGETIATLLHYTCGACRELEEKYHISGNNCWLLLDKSATIEKLLNENQIEKTTLIKK